MPRGQTSEVFVDAVGRQSIITNMSEAIQLNAREELIQRTLQMTEDEAERLLAKIERLEDLEDAEAILLARKEVGIPLDEPLAENGFTREELEAEARAEGLIN